MLEFNIIYVNIKVDVLLLYIDKILMKWNVIWRICKKKKKLVWIKMLKCL